MADITASTQPLKFINPLACKAGSSSSKISVSTHKPTVSKTKEECIQIIE
jgi:hypothetical protein